MLEPMVGNVQNGYRTDQTAGGNTITIFLRPNFYSPQLGEVALGNSITIQKTALRSNRLWMQIKSDGYYPEGWVLAVGNTGIEYIRITNRVFSSTTLLDTKKELIFGTNNDTTNPVLKNDQEAAAADVTAVADVNGIPDLNPTTTYGSTNYLGIAELYPAQQKEDVANAIYTEGGKNHNAHIPDGINIDNGAVSGVEEYTTFLESAFTDNLNIVKFNLNILTNTDVVELKNKLLHEFNRFKIDYPDYHLNKSFSYVFFTRPDLNIFDSSDALVTSFAKDPIFYYLNESDHNLLKSLTVKFASEHHLMPYLSNLAGSFEISDEFIKTAEYGETYTGYKIQYGRHNIESKTAGTFSINYTDDSNLSIYKLHKAWVEYISRVYRGEAVPKREHIIRKILDYACSAYYFVCGPDGETIIFWSKYYGVFPTNTPSSTASWSRGSAVKLPEYSINYAYSMKEDYNPLILTEFNYNSGGSNGSFVYKKAYIPGLGTVGNTFSGHPFIESIKNSNSYMFKLRFRDTNKGGGNVG